MAKEVKQLPTLGVLGVYTGILLKDRGFSEIHEVMDHLYPGIMTLGCAMMAGSAKKEITRQWPEFTELGDPKEDWQDYADAALTKYGPTIGIEGPV